MGLCYTRLVYDVSLTSQEGAVMGRLPDTAKAISNTVSTVKGGLFHQGDTYSACLWL